MGGFEDQMMLYGRAVTRQHHELGHIPFVMLGNSARKIHTFILSAFAARAPLTMIRQTIFPLFLIVLTNQTLQAGAVFTQTISPSADGLTTRYRTVFNTEHSLPSSVTLGMSDPFTGGGSGAPAQPIRYSTYAQVGDPFRSPYNVDWFLGGIAGAVTVQGPTGREVGVWLDDDGGGTGDDGGVFLSGSGTYTTSIGEVWILDMPTYTGGFLAAFNPGIYTNNSNVTYIIETTPFTSNPVPEPASIAMWSVLGGVGLVARRRKRRTQQAV